MKRLRELCTQHGALLVFDEVMTGFRVALGGAQSLYAQAHARLRARHQRVRQGHRRRHAAGGVRRQRAVMEQLAPLGPVYQAGTLVGQPGRDRLRPGDAARDRASPASSRRSRRRTRALVDGLAGAAREAGVPFAADCEGGMFGFFFADALPQNYAAVMATDKERFNRFFHAMLERGVYLAPALYEAGFVSAAHSDDRHRRDARSGARGAGADRSTPQAGDERSAVDLAGDEQVLGAQHRLALLAGKV